MMNKESINLEHGNVIPEGVINLDRKELCGSLTMYESEGGFAPIDIEIDGKELGCWIAEIMGVYSKANRGGNLDKEGEIGKCRITFERL